MGVCTSVQYPDDLVSAKRLEKYDKRTRNIKKNKVSKFNIDSSASKEYYNLIEKFNSKDVNNHFNELMKTMQKKEKYNLYHHDMYLILTIWIFETMKYKNYSVELGTNMNIGFHTFKKWYEQLSVISEPKKSIILKKLKLSFLNIEFGNTEIIKMSYSKFLKDYLKYSKVKFPMLITNKVKYGEIKFSFKDFIVNKLNKIKHKYILECTINKIDFMTSHEVIANFSDIKKFKLTIGINDKNKKIFTRYEFHKDISLLYV